MAFFKRHDHLCPNNSLYKLRGGRSILKGDVIVMRVGSTSSYLNKEEVIRNRHGLCKHIKSHLASPTSHCKLIFVVFYLWRNNNEE